MDAAATDDLRRAVAHQPIHRQRVARGRGIYKGGRQVGRGGARTRQRARAAAHQPIHRQRVARGGGIYKGGRQVGRATTTTWPPVFKKLIAPATISPPYFAEGTSLEFTLSCLRSGFRLRS